MSTIESIRKMGFNLFSTIFVQGIGAMLEIFQWERN